MKVDHIGYLTKDLDACAQALAQLGFNRLTPDIRDDVPDGRGRSRNVQLCFMENEGTVVELVSPLGEDSDVYNRLKTNGEGPYHICFAAENLAKTLETMRGQGWRVLRRPEPAVAFGGAPVAFLVKKGAGMVEIVERREMSGEETDYVPQGG